MFTATLRGRTTSRCCCCSCLWLYLKTPSAPWFWLPPTHKSNSGSTRGSKGDRFTIEGICGTLLFHVVTAGTCEGWTGSLFTLMLFTVAEVALREVNLVSPFSILLCFCWFVVALKVPGSIPGRGKFSKCPGVVIVFFTMFAATGEIVFSALGVMKVADDRAVVLC